MSYQLYRNTTLGTTLQDSLDELLQTQQISPSLKTKVLEEVKYNIIKKLTGLFFPWFGKEQ
jgi:hypothetical protein